MLDRRKFLGSAAASVLVVASGLLGLPAIARATSMRQGSFESLLNTRFLALTKGKRVGLELVAVEPFVVIEERGAAVELEQFSLLFAGPPGVPAGRYALRHSRSRMRLGNYYLEPSVQNQVGNYYRIVCSLLV